MTKGLPIYDPEMIALAIEIKTALEPIIMRHWEKYCRSPEFTVMIAPDTSLTIKKETVDRFSQDWTAGFKEGLNKAKTQRERTEQCQSGM